MHHGQWRWKIMENYEKFSYKIDFINESTPATLNMMLYSGGSCTERRPT